MSKRLKVELGSSPMPPLGVVLDGGCENERKTRGGSTFFGTAEGFIKPSEVNILSVLRLHDERYAGVRQLVPDKTLEMRLTGTTGGWGGSAWRPWPTSA